MNNYFTGGSRFAFFLITPFLPFPDVGIQQMELWKGPVWKLLPVPLLSSFLALDHDFLRVMYVPHTFQTVRSYILK
jgi:hypothetical protein